MNIIEGKYCVPRICPSKHGGQFPGLSQAQFASFIQGIMDNASDYRNLKYGRKAFWDDVSGTIVIVNPNAPDWGTAFKPDRGKAYFDELDRD